MSHHHRLAGTSNLLVHDDARAMKAIGSIGSAVKRSISPGATWSKAAKDFDDQKKFNL
jgi:hypothetical protein